MCKKLKIGVMGVNRGNFMLKAAAVLSDEMQIAAICETNDDTIESVKELLSEDTKIYKDFDEFIHSGLDGVLLSNYFHEHAKYAIKAMEAGVAVLSETTAAPSLGECVDLVEAYEKFGGKYMLAANCLYFQPLTGIMERLKTDEYGPVVYAEAEYIHTPHPDAKPPQPDVNNLHWRNTLPSCYYNMHTLGPLMYITKTEPTKVLCKAAVLEREGRLNNTPKSFTLTEMDNGAVFNTTGCVGTGTDSKWYRVACQKGTYESQRYDYHFEPLVSMGHSVQQTGISYPDWEWGDVPEEKKPDYRRKLTAIGHGGIDFFVVLNFLRYLRGEIEPFFDVYRSVRLSAVGILSWYSVLNDSKQYDVPDFRTKEAREACRGDYRMPFGKKLDELTLPCRVDN